MRPNTSSISCSRKAAYYTQVEFAARVRISQRMAAYYEASGAQPPAHLLPQTVEVLSLGADVLLGMAQPRKVKQRFLQAVGVAADVQRHRVMQQPIEDRGGDRAIAEHVVPASDAL